jgi:hypothetical protein
MPGPNPMSRVLFRASCVASVSCALALACGGSVDNSIDARDGSADASGGGGTHAEAGDAPHASGGGGVGGTGGSVHDGSAPDGSDGGYVDPGCPDASPPPTQFDCDPFGPNTCPGSQACFPWVNYPTKPCEQETFGASCSAAGSAVQGEFCGYVSSGSVALCAPGFLCVINGQNSSSCVQLCKLGSANTCPKGLLCLPVDITGIGGCD